MCTELLGGAGWGRRIRRSLGGAVAAAVLVLATTSCSGGSGTSLAERVRADLKAEADEAREAGSTAKADALEDGVLTDSEIDSLHSLYRECMTKTGAEMSSSHRNPVDGRTWIDWETNFDELTPATNEPRFDCLVTFDIANAASLEPKPMAAPLRSFLDRCLAKADIQLQGDDRTVQDIYRSVGEANVGKLGGCITDGMAERYPEIEAVEWGPPSVY